jgi:photosystem II stability/assembly factor-like uncharacterized protein
MLEILKYFTLLMLISFIFTAKAQQDIWEQAGDFNSGRVWAMHTDQSGRVYASSGSLLYRSIDLGDSWELIGDFTTWSTDIYDIEINSRGDIFLASSNTVGAFRSIDDGETWEELLNKLVPSTYEITINPSNDDLFAATDSGFFISTDNGDRWIERSEGLPNRSVTTILFTQNGDLFAGTFGDGIYRSTDYGLSWVEKRDGLFSWFMLEVVEGYNNDLFCSEEGGAPFRSTDNGDSWVYMNNGLPGIAVLWAILPISSSRIFVAGEHIGVYTSYDSSLTWREFNSGMNTPHALSLTITKNDILFAGTFDNGVFRTKQKVTSLDDDFNNSPSDYYLFQNYPNPFNPSTTIKYSIPESGKVTITVYDLLGREITTLVNEFKSDVSYAINFDAKNLASGVYFYRITASKNGRILFTDSKQMILLK